MASGRVLLNLAGGEGLDDLNQFEADSARRSRWLRPCASAARTSRQPISLFNQVQRQFTFLMRNWGACLHHTISSAEVPGRLAIKSVCRALPQLYRRDHACI
jgi:hypothetical protein